MSKISSFAEFTNQSADETIKVLGSNQTTGLSSQEVKSRLAHYGPNEITGRETKWWQILLRQLRSPFIYLLMAAAAVAFWFGGKLDAFLILIFIAINTGLGFYQEFRSDRSLKLLKSYLTIHASIRRNNSHEEVDVRELVPGDIIDLQAGDIVPADCRVLETDGLSVNESILTGESVTVDKSTELIKTKTPEIYQAKNILFSGTSIATGSASAVVVATGPATAIGSIAKLTTETVKESEFSRGVAKFSGFILRLILLTIVIIFIANVLVKGDKINIGELLVFAIALAVSVIPEALPVVSIFSLSHGAVKLAKKKVVVRRLSAIEDLGGIDILCTDKTGTITENRLTIAETLENDPGQPSITYGALAALTSRHQKSTDPFNTVFEESLPESEKKVVKSCRLLDEAPFDPVRRRNSVLVSYHKKILIVVRGAPEEVLDCCRSKPSPRVKKWVTQQGQLGRRVLAIAVKELGQMPGTQLSNYENNLRLAGLIAFEDPIKKTTKPAVNKAGELGIKVKILTGDAPQVAGAVAVKIGLINDLNQVITGKKFVSLNSDQQQEATEKYQVFARVSPEQKHAIVSILSARHAVGFLGEGINDAPALKAASVSLIVKGGSDIAREASDVILLQKSLAVIVDGIQEGRKVFANTLKYIRATLSSNFGNFYAVAIASLFIDFLPMLPVQILLVNLLSDFPMISIATDNTGQEDISQPQRYNVRDIALIATLLGIVSTIFDFIFFALYFQISPATLQTNWFIASIITELVFLFSIRTKKFAFTAVRPANLVLWLSGLAFIITLVLPYSSWGHSIFHFTSPPLTHLVTILTLTAVYFLTSEITKLSFYRFFSARQSVPSKS